MAQTLGCQYRRQGLNFSFVARPAFRGYPCGMMNMNLLLAVAVAVLSAVSGANASPADGNLLLARRKPIIKLGPPTPQPKPKPGVWTDEAVLAKKKKIIRPTGVSLA